MNAIRWFLTLYPVAKFLYFLGLGPQPVQYYILGDDVQVNPNPNWKATHTQQLTACDNRPGLKKLYITVLDEKGAPLSGIKVRFGVEPSQGTAYDHPNVWGLTNEQGYVEWDHLGVPTRYMLWMEDDETPLVENIRTDLGYEYCGDGWGSWRPVNRPGVYSYRFEIQRKGDDDEAYQKPVISNMQVRVADIEEQEGYAEVLVTCSTDRLCEADAHWAVAFEDETCDPFSSLDSGIGEAALEHEISLGKIWCNKSAPVAFCLAVVAWEPQYRGVPRCYGISEFVRFSVP